MIEISPGDRRALRAAAHHLNPVVSIAANGLTPSVQAEIERSLQAHELIKIKVHGIERAERELLLAQVCNALEAAPVQHIGTILVVWRKRRETEGADEARTAKAIPTRRPAKEKSARAFVAAARRAALIQTAADKKRKQVRRPRNTGAKSPVRGD